MSPRTPLAGAAIAFGLALGLVAGACRPAAAAPAAAPAFLPPIEGWVSWEVATVDQAPAWCCFDAAPARSSGPGRCELDGAAHGFGSRNGERTDTLRVYARIKGGQVDRVRALAPACEVRMTGSLHHLGPRPADQSAAFLGTLLAMPVAAGGREPGHARSWQNERFRQVLAALALHRGSAALDLLVREARGNRPPALRKEAVFWIGQGRGDAGVAALKPLMFEEPEASLREHAAFSAAQARTAMSADLLVRQAQQDVSAHVRSQAWFWLAETRGDIAEPALMTALGNERDLTVRHQAVFALSRLPEPRAARALAAVAQNRALDREVRKQALFWLGQSRAPEAVAFLERTLLRAAP